MTENTKLQYVLLLQTIIQNGIETVSRYNRIVCEDDETLYCGVIDGIELKSRTLFAGEAGRGDITFGPNRRFFATSLLLWSRDGEVIAQIKYRNFHLIGFGNKARNSVLDANGEVLLDLVPSEYFESSVTGMVLGSLSHDLVLKRGDNVLGYTGASPGGGKRWAKTLENVSGGIIDEAQNAFHLLGKLTETPDKGEEEAAGDSVSPETVAQTLTLVGEGTTLDPRLVLVVLLFKEYFHRWRAYDGGPNSRKPGRIKIRFGAF